MHTLFKLNIAVVVLVFTTSVIAAGTSANSPIWADTFVKQSFPEELTDESTKYFADGGPEPTQLYEYTEVDFDGNGKPNYIVAAYSNGYSGAVRVFKKQAQTAVLISSPSFDMMAGVFPSVSLVDIDGDGHQEVVVGFTTVSGETSSDWVLQWDGTTLRSIAPIVYGAAFIDLTGSGKLNIISADMEGPLLDNKTPATVAVYSLSNGIYTKTGTFNIFKHYRRDKATPTAKEISFTIANTAGPYVMTIVNGSGKSKQISSAQITLNGQVVAQPDMFNQKTNVLLIPVTLTSTNTLSVTLYGAPGSRLSIGIGPK